MGQSLELLLGGLASALTAQNLMYAVIGCFVGTLIGVLPGIGSAGGMALLIPLTSGLPVTGAIIMLAAIFYGSYYGGTITTILLNVPGETASAVTALDGYAMAKNGQAGAALSVAAIGSFVGGTVSVMGLVFAGSYLQELALHIGPPEFFALMVVGLALLVVIVGKSLPKTLLMAAFGLLLGTIGTDPTLGAPRFTFGRPELLDGLSFIPVVMGIFGLSEILTNLDDPGKHIFAPIKTLIPTRLQVRESTGAVGRGTVVGFFLGLIPGTTQTLASMLSYSWETKHSKSPEKFGKGAIEGVAGPETANNAHANAALIPLMTLGLPGSPSIAILLGAFMIHGLVPGPLLFEQHPDIAWTIIASMLVGNVILLILNLPLIGIWVRILKIPYPILIAAIVCMMLIGSYTINNSMFDVGILVIFGLVGYLCKRANYPPSPFVLALILGPLLEKRLRTSLDMSAGDLGIFIQRPISALLLLLAVVILISPMFGFARRMLRGGKAAETAVAVGGKWSDGEDD